MKKTFTIILTSLMLIMSACKSSTEIKTNVSTATLIKEVTDSEVNLFSLLKSGKINEAFAMHSADSTYKNIVDGISRTHAQMDSVLKSNTSKNVKAYDYNVSTRNFLIVDSTNVLETVEANRKLISKTDSEIENRPVVLSILWTKNNSKWIVSYLHSSYRKEK